MAKGKMIDLTSTRPATGTVRRSQPRVIRVRRETRWRGKTRYCMNDWFIVPAWARHLDGRSTRGVALAALVVLALVGYGLARLLLGGGR